jgi:cytochrome c oxidase cbb3-type subunit III
MSGQRDMDDLSGVDTTGHEWDGIKELNNPLPRWWLWTLYATIIWSVGYMVVYPAIPGLTSASKGLWDWSSRADIRTELAAVEESRKAIAEKVATMDINTIMADEATRSFAVSGGASLFKVYCSQCHGSGAQGGPGYPNLNDDSWLWGGTPEQIQQSIAHGIRDASNSDTRDSMMPAFGKDDLLTSQQIVQVANHVRKLAGLDHDAVAATAGAKVFAENETCSACHGANGEGKTEFGAPQLNDAVWLRGSELDDIIAQIHEPKHGMMPGWQARLGQTRVKQLTAYVISRGGAQ